MRIYFNHWFSQAYNLINAIKAEDPSVYIIGTNERDTAVYQFVCDEFYVEPHFDNEDEYAMWCLNFCKEHNIDVFAPRRNRVAIAKHYNEYIGAGIKLMVDNNSELMALLEDKVKTAQLFEKHNICKVPELLVATNIDEFKKHYAYLKEKYPKERVCFKYVEDEGATSFRVIDDIADDIKVLKTGAGMKISYDKAVEILGSVDSFDPLILMIYLKGPEISVDSLMTNKGFIGCSRTKIGTRGTVIDPHSELVNISKHFAEVTGIKCPYNVQFRWHDGELYLLEVNTRMAGGTYKSCQAGLNFAYLALCDVLGKDFELPTNTKKVIVSEIETPVLLKEFREEDN